MIQSEPASVYRRHAEQRTSAFHSNNKNQEFPIPPRTTITTFGIHLWLLPPHSAYGLAVPPLHNHHTKILASFFPHLATGQRLATASCLSHLYQEKSEETKGKHRFRLLYTGGTFVTTLSPQAPGVKLYTRCLDRELRSGYRLMTSETRHRRLC